MNEIVIKHMIKFILDKEKEFQALKFATDSRLRNDMVNSILEELDSEVENED